MHTADETTQDHYDLFANRIRALTEHPDDELRGLCPFHDDHTPSWVGNRHTGKWKCFGCGAHGNASQFAERVGEPLRAEQKKRTGNIVATYPYHDEHGKLLSEVVRYSPKGFVQRKPDGKGGWDWNLHGTGRVPYRLPEVLAADPAEWVYIVEGEKDSDRLRKLGLRATCNSGGAGKWQAEFSRYFSGRYVVILPDNDDPGERHALDVAQSLLPVAASVKIMRLSGLPPKGDVSDWLDAGHTKEELTAMVEAAPILKLEDPAAEPKASKEEDRTPWDFAKPAPDFLAEEEKEFEGLAKDLLAPGAITLIAAPRGLGKTQVSHALAVALATGGVFRGERVQSVRVLLLDRDNPEFIIKKRLRAWGAEVAHHLRVLTRQNAPDLKDKAAWAAFPANDYDVLVVDSVGSSTEGITEKEGKQTTEILATIVDLARRGPAMLLLMNCTKDALTLKGRGDWADRADIVYEVRDATGFTPSGKKPWWQELPEAGEAAWADRAARRKGRVDLRLAFVPSKFRLGAEPEPFCLELYLPQDEPWTLRDVTADILKAGKDTLTHTAREKEERLQKAAAALAKVVTERAAQGTPMLKTEAEQLLQEEQGLKREGARQMLSQDSSLWRLEPCRNGEGKQAAWCLLPKNGGNGNDSENPHKMGAGEEPVVAAQAGSGRQRQSIRKVPIAGDFVANKFVAEGECVENRRAGDDVETNSDVWEEEL
jgi:hypothetical protein